MNNNKKKSAQLGMPYGTANYKLQRRIIFDLIVRHGENVCYRCDGVISSLDEMTVEHKEPWLDVDPELFWSMDNIAFSHPICNNRAGRRTKADHGLTMYRRKDCKCDKCRAANAAYRRQQRS